MTPEDAKQIVNVIITADNHCAVCTDFLRVELEKKFPDIDWLKMVNQAEEEWDGDVE